MRNQRSSFKISSQTIQNFLGQKYFPDFRDLIRAQHVHESLGAQDPIMRYVVHYLNFRIADFFFTNAVNGPTFFLIWCLNVVFRSLGGLSGFLTGWLSTLRPRIRMALVSVVCPTGNGMLTRVGMVPGPGGRARATLRRSIRVLTFKWLY